MTAFVNFLFALGSTVFFTLPPIYNLLTYGNVRPGYLGMGGLEYIVILPVCFGVSIVSVGIYCFRADRRKARGRLLPGEVRQFWLFCAGFAVVGILLYLLSQHCFEMRCYWLPER